MLADIGTASQPGRLAIGNSAPDRNIIGVMMSWVAGIADWICLIRAESRTRAR
ncbi:hypothetical protein ABZ639_16800 [Saccharomonospora sp. NPDC006951]